MRKTQGGGEREDERGTNGVPTQVVRGTDNFGLTVVPTQLLSTNLPTMSNIRDASTDDEKRATAYALVCIMVAAFVVFVTLCTPRNFERVAVPRGPVPVPVPVPGPGPGPGPARGRTPARGRAPGPTTRAMSPASKALASARALAKRRATRKTMMRHKGATGTRYWVIQRQ
jgi:hypothetical protein